METIIKIDNNLQKRSSARLPLLLGVRRNTLAFVSVLRLFISKNEGKTNIIFHPKRIPFALGARRNELGKCSSLELLAARHWSEISYFVRMMISLSRLSLPVTS